MSKALYIGTALAAMITMASTAAGFTHVAKASGLTVSPAAAAAWQVYDSPYSLTVTYRGDVYEADSELTDTDCIDAATDRPYVLKTVGLTSDDAMHSAVLACVQTGGF